MNEVAFNLYSFVNCKYLASGILILTIFSFTHKLILQHFVHFSLKWHVWVILKLLLVHILPQLKVAYLDAIKSKPHRDVICCIIGFLAIHLSFEIWILDKLSNAFENRID